jgi:hypothetical protein
MQRDWWEYLFATAIFFVPTAVFFYGRVESVEIDKKRKMLQVERRLLWPLRRLYPSEPVVFPLHMVLRVGIVALGTSQLAEDNRHWKVHSLPVTHPPLPQG